MRRRKILVVASLTMVAVLLALFFLVPKNEIYLTNGTGKTIRVKDLRIAGSLVDADVPFELDQGNAAFASFRAVAGAPRHLEIILEQSKAPASCHLERALRSCFFRVFLTAEGLNCDPCAAFPSSF